MTEAPLELCLPARRSPGEEGMLRAVDVGVLPALGIDAQLERGTLVPSIYSSASPWVGSQPCGAQYPGFCADSKDV